ncbi:radical SAM protein [Streptomyces sp. NBC_01231]|nr:radical SAM protein [Streptomyces sp. NBC_01231]
MSTPRELTAASFDKELASSFRSDRLQLILLPTEQCNFRCTYCYEDFAIGRMTSDVVSGVKNLIDRRADGLRRLQVSWFGGEPMLARSIIEEVASHAILVQDRNSNLRYESDMTTNGYMLNGEAAEFLAGIGVRTYQISLDGPGKYHDRTRLRADGKGTFDQIWCNLLSIRESSAKVRILLRVHLTPDNLHVMPEFLTRVRDTFLNDPRFNVFLKRVVRLGGPNDATMDVLDSDDQQVADLEALLVEGGRTERLFEPEEVCYAARANSLLVRADGRLGKCTVALSDPDNTIGRLLPDGSLEIDNPRLRPWLQGWESRDPELTACPYVAFTREPQPLLQITKPPSKTMAHN